MSSKAIKIALICNYKLKPQRVGGMDRFYVAYNKKLIELGYLVHWYMHDYVEFDFFDDLIIFNAKGASIEVFFLDQMRHQNADYKFIVTHFLELCTPFYKKVKKNCNAKIIAVDHNPRPYKGFSIKKRVKNKLKGILFSKYIDKFVGVSKYTKYHIISDYGSSLNKKTVVIYNGVKTSVFRKKTTDFNYKFIVASHLRPSKGIIDLLKALLILSDSSRNKISIDIYGEGPSELDLKKFIINYGLENIVNFMGSSSKLNVLYANYSYMIQPTYMECFSLSILESLASNLPVITTEVGGNLEVLQDGVNGFIFKAGDINKLAQILENIISGIITIDFNVGEKIESEFYLEKMVNEHIKLLECI